VELIFVDGISESSRICSSVASGASIASLAFAASGVCASGVCAFAAFASKY
jgi:hypothetical protein